MLVVQGKKRVITQAYLNAAEAPPLERRRLERVGVRLPGKYMREDRKELACSTINISAGGMALAAEEDVRIGEIIIAYVNPLGRIRGVVRRLFYGGFAISMDLPPNKQEKLSGLLLWLADPQQSERPDLRLHVRIKALHPNTTVTLPNGRAVYAKIIDFSRADAALTLAGMTATDSPELGVVVTVGSRRAVIARLFPGGVAIEFARMIPPQEFSENFQL